MNRRLRSAILPLALLLILLVGCVSDHQTTTDPSQTDVTPVPGRVVGNYVVAPRDDIGTVLGQFGMSIEQFRALNPGVNPAVLTVGRTIKVYRYSSE